MDPSFAVDFETHPSRYRHWALRTEGATATLALKVDEDGGLVPGYKLKLNSYDLGVDIELHDAVQRIRFEHPQIRTVIITSDRERVFCSGANIFMLGQSTHAWKVNFCKFTNETRNGIEDASRHSGLKFIAAVNGACAGGGYELAMACDEIILIDDRSSAVSLPEVPLLGVLPGTGGLTRLTDKRRVRHDLADVFCTTSEGVRGQRAKDWRLVDEVVKPQGFAQRVQERARELAAASDRPAQAKGVVLPALTRTLKHDGIAYRHVDLQFDRAARHATITVSAPMGAQPLDIAGIEQAGAQWYALEMARELDDAILHLRANEPELGTWIIKTRGSADAVSALDATLLAHSQHWFVRETIGLLRRTLARLDVSSRSIFALADRGSCFVGSFFELALAADRIYLQHLPDESEAQPRVGLTGMNLGLLPMVSHETRLQRRLHGHELNEAQQSRGQLLDADEAMRLGLATATPDDIDWDDEIRIALEERASMSADALTGLEANLRFTGRESMETRIFARLSAWQNWIFQRPNAVGEGGALKVYGTGTKPQFDRKRI
ncbi:2,3-epoxybenzoyl-CoA dihydrolase [Piscinibacter terrae]|uniref:Benzoyl-CoA-dihydrodiol lyase n=1 Tax=Piscinibacter terrae TaxID=2496871 RepID=A0A3N7HKC1_9BURK|nr:2,3-epoxybenzoyl-CoA dihydrolase [Albitalea terrae]RQP22524.1 benzoyl-CoA-dihydrodiol lyase [Albitalea terrae]